jgi:hypothetical protein
MADIKLQPVGQMQQVQPAAQDNLPREQQEKLPAYSERYYDDYFEYRCGARNPSARSLTAIGMTRTTELI